MIEYLEHRTAGLDHPIRRQAFTQQVVARDGAVGKIDVGSMVDDSTIRLFLKSKCRKQKKAFFKKVGRKSAHFFQKMAIFDQISYVFIILKIEIWN